MRLGDKEECAQAFALYPFLAKVAPELPRYRENKLEGVHCVTREASRLMVWRRSLYFSSMEVDLRYSEQFFLIQDDGAAIELPMPQAVLSPVWRADHANLSGHFAKLEMQRAIQEEKAAAEGVRKTPNEERALETFHSFIKKWTGEVKREGLTIGQVLAEIKGNFPYLIYAPFLQYLGKEAIHTHRYIVILTPPANLTLQEFAQRTLAEGELAVLA